MARIGGQTIPRSTLLLVGGEGVLIYLALLFATVVRLPDTSLAWSCIKDPATISRLLVVVLICVVSFYYHDLYDLQLIRSVAQTSVKLLRGLGVALLVLGVAYLINSSLSPGEGVAIMAAPFIIIMMVTWRVSLRSLGSRTHGMERVLIAGSGTVGLKLIGEIQRRPEFNYKVIGALSEREDQEGGDLSAPILGSVADIERIATELRIDRIVVSLKERRGGMPTRALMRLKFRGIQIEDPYTLYERLTGRIVLENLSPSWFIFSNGFRKPWILRFAKRASDLLIAVLGLALSSPLMVLVALVIILEDGFPILYRQERVGLNGGLFKILKFRSMRAAPPNEKPSWTGDRDPRITRVGKFIRTVRLDELPQFINVLRGDMSVVGPRPEQPYFCDMLEEEIPYFGYRHTVRPGITGWAQIKYGYGATTEDAWRKVELDLFYIKYLSGVLDLAILFETAKVVFFGRGAR